MWGRCRGEGESGGRCRVEEGMEGKGRGMAGNGREWERMGGRLWGTTAP